MKMNLYQTTVVLFILLLMESSCAYNQHGRWSSNLPPPSSVDSVTSAINNGNWNILRKLAAQGIKAEHFVKKWENSAESGRPIHVGDFVSVENINLPDGRPCTMYTYKLMDKDGSQSGHGLQVIVEQVNGKSAIVDFWELGW
jgi:hypothetical protein